MEKLAVQGTLRLPLYQVTEVQILSPRLLRRPLFSLRPRPVSCAPLPTPQLSQQLLLLTRVLNMMAINRTTTRGSYPSLNLTSVDTNVHRTVKLV